MLIMRDHYYENPVNMPECASTESELKQCCRHPFNSDSVPAHSGMFTGIALSEFRSDMISYLQILITIIDDDNDVANEDGFWSIILKEDV